MMSDRLSSVRGGVRLRTKFVGEKVVTQQSTLMPHAESRQFWWCSRKTQSSKIGRCNNVGKIVNEFLRIEETRKGPGSSTFEAISHHIPQMLITYDILLQKCYTAWFFDWPNDDRVRT